MLFFYFLLFLLSFVIMRKCKKFHNIIIDQSPKKEILSNEFLPRELVSNILSRLQAKDLMKCKHVCKSWYKLITHPHFINNYHIFYNKLMHRQSREQQFLIIRRPFFSSLKTFISLLSCDFSEPNNGYVSSHLLNPSNEFHSDHKYWTQIMGPCNGIYFLEGNPYVMMNPSINQFKVLPQSHLTRSEGTYSLTDHVGFGFDSKINDYKVVVIKDIWLKETDERKLMHWTVELFSLKSNSWREFDDADLPPSIEIWESSKVHTFVNNCCHWLGFVDEFDIKEDVVISFDMVKEVFRKIDVPRIRESSKETSATVVPFNESTSIGVIVYPKRGIEKKFDVWVLRDYWDEGTWIKQYSIEPIEVMYKLVGFHGINQFFWINKDEELVLYDGDSQQIKHLQVKGKNNSLRVVVYMESLVSLRTRNDSIYQFVSCSFVNDNLLNTRE
ncbi:PREDICTED: F-box protein CPR30-like [Lupinus angustifolius]|uniref:F-box protein CPR30-like n=1 Tax=Lupinus angustifolius TaxID=3871 RepID=UPI00092F085D|nr:PREDICTED: F-box protein CPR30-like [Lupinus angustifolius]